MEFHPIGHGSSFDADILQVELFVEHSKNPENYEANLKLYHYYILNAYIYKDYTLKLLEKINQSSQIDPFIEIFNDYVKQINDDFEKNKIVNMVVIYRLYLFIGLVLCKKIIPMSVNNMNLYLSQSDFLGIYVLPNGVGFFGINAYLYALFENIHIVGLPIRDAIADTNLLCPYHFLIHDEAHASRIGDSKKKNMMQMKNIYYRTLKDTNTDYKFKEFLLCVIFIFVHEYYYSDFTGLVSNDYIKFISNMINGNEITTSELVKSKFLDDYKYLLDPEKTASFLNMIETNQNQFISKKYGKNFDTIEFLFLFYHGLKFIVENYFDENNSLYNDMNGLIETVGNIH